MFQRMMTKEDNVPRMIADTMVESMVIEAKSLAWLRG